VNLSSLDESNLTQACNRMLKCGWTNSKLGKVVLHLEGFNVINWFEYQLNRASYLRGVSLAWVTAV
jgi:hypothetical protein